jgi:hypothetical protein
LLNRDIAGLVQNFIDHIGSALNRSA